MTKRGHELARTALFQAAFCALRVDLGLHATYQKQIDADKHHKVAISPNMLNVHPRIVEQVDCKPEQPALLLAAAKLLQAPQLSG